MNYLAHLFLSGEDDEIRFGNYLGDHLRKAQWAEYSERVRIGLELHALIDHTTDRHPMVMASRQRMRPSQHKFSPVVQDLLYDHFLAKNWARFHSVPLEVYTRNAYERLQAFQPHMPASVLRMFEHMRTHDWLESYARLEGLNKALGGMARRTRFVSDMERAVEDLASEMDAYESDFMRFFPDLQTEVRRFLGPEFSLPF